MDIVTWIVIIIVVVIVLIIVSLNTIANKLIFVPPRHSTAKKQIVEYIGFNKEVPVAEYRPSDHSTDVIVYSHGNATDIKELHPFLQLLASELNSTVYAYEYPGYSYLKDQETDGLRCTEHLEMTVRWLIQDKQFKPSNITLIGRSLGTGPTIQVAKNNPDIGSVVLISPYKSLPRIIFDSQLTDIILPAANYFASYNHCLDVKSPITFVHGKKDTLISVKHSEDMFERRRSVHSHDRLTILDNETHNIGVGATIQVLKKNLVKQGKRSIQLVNEDSIDVAYRELVDDPYSRPLYQETGYPRLNLL